MTNVTVQLTDREIAALKARTGKRSAAAALKAWAVRANAKRSAADLRTGLKESLKEEAVGRGRYFFPQRPSGHSLARELIILPRFKRKWCNAG